MYKSSFTLIELLIVVAIIGILAGVIVISMASATEKARNAKLQVFSNSMRDSLGASLVSEWKFDGVGVADGEVATEDYFKDSWGGNNGTATSAPIVKTGEKCVSGSCLEFNGSSFIVIGNKNSLNPENNEFTISAFAKIDNALSASGFIVSKGNSGSNGYGLWISSLGYATGDYCNGSIRASLYDNKNNKDNQWHHFALVRRNDGKTYLYLDGIFRLSSVNQAFGSISTTDNFYIGQNKSNGQRFIGLIDEVRVYNSALTAAEIRQQYYSMLNYLALKSTK